MDTGSLLSHKALALERGTVGEKPVFRGGSCPTEEEEKEMKNGMYRK